MENNTKKPQQIFTKQNNTKATPFTERKSTELLTNSKAWPVSRNSRRRDQQPPVPSGSRIEQSRYNNNNNNFNNNNNTNNYYNTSGKQHQYPTASSGKFRNHADKRPKARNSNASAGGIGPGDSGPMAIDDGDGAPHVQPAANGVQDSVCQLDDVAVAGAGLAAPAEAPSPSAAGGRGAVPKRRTTTPSTTASNAHHDYELNSIYAPGSKKQNLNHLLNFHYGARDADYTVDKSLNMFGRGGNAHGAQQRHGGGSGGGGAGNVKKHKFNKEEFMQANFQFAIKSTGKTLNMVSPDTLIDWNLIEQINIQTTEEPQCPICLYPPIAAKLTRCGHAYCWPCLLHYLALSEKTWRKCPICYEAVHINDLKSTVIVQQRPFNVGAQITFQLMRRKKDSLFVEKHDVHVVGSPLAEEHNHHYPFMSSADDIKVFSKLLIAKRSDILSIIERERAELIGGDDATVCLQDTYIQQALQLLDERLDKLGGDEKSGPPMKAPHEPIGDGVDGAEPRTDSPTSTSPTMLSGASQKYYYFYQSQDGQNVFLHPLNVKMLQACYGSLEHGPAIISSRILQKEHHSMDEEHRRKFTCLSHLPLTCQFAVVEVELQPPVVTDDIMRVFKDEVHNRRKERQRRDREERKREKHINEINDRQMGKLIASTTKLNLSSAQEFPTCGFEDYLSGGAPAGGDGRNASSTASGGAPANRPQSSGNRSSYSTVAVDGRSNLPTADYWPSIKSSSGVHTTTTYNSYQELSTWGKPQERRHIVGAANSAASDNADNVDDMDGVALVTPMHTNLSDVLAEAMLQKKQAAGKPNNGGAHGGQAGKKKAKPKKMQPLFTTGINFNGN